MNIKPVQHEILKLIYWKVSLGVVSNVKIFYLNLISLIAHNINEFVKTKYYSFYKAGDKFNKKNYRPTVVTNSIDKILKKLKMGFLIYKQKYL